MDTPYGEFFAGIGLRECVLTMKHTLDQFGLVVLAPVITRFSGLTMFVL